MYRDTKRYLVEAYVYGVWNATLTTDDEERAGEVFAQLVEQTSHGVVELWDDDELIILFEAGKAETKQ